jgi:hypothetical protein
MLEITESIIPRPIAYIASQKLKKWRDIYFRVDGCLSKEGDNPSCRFKWNPHNIHMIRTFDRNCNFKGFFPSTHVLQR